MKVGTIAGVLGAIVGVWTALGSTILNSDLYGARCNPTACAALPSQFLVFLLGAFGVILAIDSVLALVGPRIAFYGEAVVAAIVAFLFFLAQAAMNQPAFWGSFLVSILTLALAVVAGRKKSGISEQANPMNLPVFG